MIKNLAVFHSVCTFSAGKSLLQKHENNFLTIRAMCFYPRLIKNPRYRGCEYLCDDMRKLLIPIGCGNCYECRKQKAQQWRVRLLEEFKQGLKAYFVTLTFAPEEAEKFYNETGIKEGNAFCGKAIRRFLERWRKDKGKSLRHWFITELGHEGTERIHLHGIIFTNEPMNNQILEHYWRYGRADTGKYCNERSINYIIKYVTKVDTDHKSFKAQIFCSAGLGSNFVNTPGAQATYKYKQGASAEHYTLKSGRRIALPIYYRNKLYTEEERDRLWTDRLDRDERYINGIRIRDASKHKKQIYELLQEMQEWNKGIGYGDLSKEWQKEEYNITLRMLKKPIKYNL